LRERVLGRLAVTAMEADFPVVGRTRRSRELPDGVDDRGQVFVVCANACIQFGEFFVKHFVVGEKLPQLNESPDDVHAHVGRGIRIEDVGRLDRAVLGKGVREEAWVPMAAGTGRNLRPVVCKWLNVVGLTCDRSQLLRFGDGDLKHKVGRKFSGVALHLFVEALGGDAVERSQIGIEKHTLAADGENAVFESSWHETSAKVGQRAGKSRVTPKCRVEGRRFTRALPRLPARSS
jgi:hypothetical protein